LASRGRLTENLAAMNQELSDAQTKRAQETNSIVLAGWDEWISFLQAQVTYFQGKLDMVNGLYADYTAQKAEIEAKLTTNCDWPNTTPAFDFVGL
jgi:hypothetical protein